MDEHVYVTAAVTDPAGERSEHYLGSLPAWAWADPKARREWLKPRRANVTYGTSGRGWRFAYTAHTADEYEARETAGV